MPPVWKWLLLSAVAAVLVEPGRAQQSSPENAPKPAVSPLTRDEIKAAAAVDSLTVPTPGEFFKAIDKTGKPNWVSQYRPPPPINGVNRAQMALNLGTLIADGFIAVEAQDGQQVKNIGRDVLALAKKLSVSDSVLARGKSITQFAEDGSWDQLNEELEATQNEVKKALQDNRDTDLITLVSIGGWIRGTQVVTGLLAESYSPETARLLRQPALVSYLRGKLTQLPSRLRQDKVVVQVDSGIQNIAKLVSFPADHVPTADEVKNLNEAATKLTKEISTGE
ncbi:MAG: hypothetical protein JO333_11780 [Verrucomicrobia bacterium]|nr:hypothetical protein [Verrucomicrobiota bacterium]